MQGPARTNSHPPGTEPLAPCRGLFHGPVLGPLQGPVIGTNAASMEECGLCSVAR